LRQIWKARGVAVNLNRRSYFVLAALGLSLPLALAVQAEDWPQWRGPNRDGVWNETGILQSFPAGGLTISWRVPIGPGYSSPVVVQGRVYVTDSQIARPTARERVLCFDAKTGRNLWTHSYEVDYADWAFDPKNPFGPRPTPLVSRGRIFTLGARGRLCCLEARNGEVIWEKALENKSKDSAFTPSPLIEGKLLILVLDGSPPGPCVVALDKNTGKEVWRALEETATFSSPILVTAAGKRQLIVWTEKWVNSLDPVTGKPYWRERYPGGVSYAVPTPASHADLLLVNGVMFQLDLKKPGAAVLWPDGTPPSRRTVSDTSAALFQGDHLFTCNLNGELVCLEAKTGRIVWGTNVVTDAKSGASMHITANGKSALLFNDKGELIRAGLTVAGYQEISRAALLQPTSPFGSRKMAWTPPAYADRHVFARSDEELVCASLAAKP
jgi:outer membrane protein assembly factor BamB